MARILVVDDDMAVRTFVSRALRQRGHEIDEASDSEAALAVTSGLDAIDLMISDIMMPGMDGVTLAHEAVRQNGDLKVLLMTGFSGGRNHADGKGGSPFDMIMKPFSLRDICTAADDALSRPSVEV